MAKRELSSTLRNLKFMQRGAQKEEKSKKEEEPQPVIPDGNFTTANTQIRKCIVIMEGNPHPGAMKGRMSFQSFNPSIDKLNEPAENPCQRKETATSTCNGRTPERENGTSFIGSEGLNECRRDSDSDGDHKRKHPGNAMETQYPNKSPKSGEGDQLTSPNNRNGSRKQNKQNKRERLDWNLLRPPKAQNRSE